jgi:hypothetical protein
MFKYHFGVFSEDVVELEFAGFLFGLLIFELRLEDNVPLFNCEVAENADRLRLLEAGNNASFALNERLGLFCLFGFFFHYF